MATSTPAHVTPRVLRWARESVGYDVDAAAEKIGVPRDRLESAEQGSGLLSLQEAEKAAETYDRPLAALFLPNPPPEPAPEAEFRLLPDAPAPPWSPELIKLFRQVRERQDAATDVYDLLEERPPWLASARAMAQVPRASLAAATRQLLGVGSDTQMSWRDSQGYRALRGWVDAVERLGALVMQRGDVPNSVMRGFASPHETVPAVVINTDDDARARAFSIIHELGHLWLGARNESMARAEAWCNNFAGEVIMPRRLMVAVYEARRAGKNELQIVDELGLTFGVTPLAAAVRLRRLRLIDAAILDDIKKSLGARQRRKSKGGNYYRNQINRVGPSFVRLVLTGLDSQVLTYPRASALLNVRVNHFDKLREYIAERSAPA